MILKIHVEFASICACLVAADLSFCEILLENIRLVYDNKTRTVHSLTEVDIRVPGFGGTETVEWLDPSHASTGSYFYDIVNELVKLGYTRNNTIKGAPYDFRKTPYENEKYFVKLKKLIENTYEENKQTPVIMLAHSLGAPMSLMFLNKHSQYWKEKYVKSLVTLSRVWGGTVKAVKVYATGDNLGSYLLRQNVMKREQITSPSLSFLLSSKLYWKPDEILVETAIKNYTVNDLEDFFKEISFSTGWEMRKDTEPCQHFKAPGVEVHCIYGTNIQTVQKLYYGPDTSLHDDPTFIYGDGDGSVNTHSLKGCLQWRTQQKQKVYAYNLPKIDHFSILYEQIAIKALTNSIIRKRENKTRKKHSWF